MLLRLAYLGVTNMFALLRLLPRNDHDKDTEILVLRHQLSMLRRHLGDQRLGFQPADRALLAALLHPLPRPVLRQLQLLVRPDTILRWHRDLLPRRHAAASRPRRWGRPRTLRSIRALVLRLAQENSTWGYRRVHGELLTLGVKVAASTVWEILRQAGVDPASDRAATTWASFLRSQTHALLAADFIETVTLTGTRMYILAVIEHTTRRVRILGATPHPTAAWVTQAARNLAMDLYDAGSRTRYLARDRDGKYPSLFDAVLAGRWGPAASGRSTRPRRRCSGGWAWAANVARPFLDGRCRSPRTERRGPPRASTAAGPSAVRPSARGSGGARCSEAWRRRRLRLTATGSAAPKIRICGHRFDPAQVAFGAHLEQGRPPRRRWLPIRC